MAKQTHGRTHRTSWSDARRGDIINTPHDKLYASHTRHFPVNRSICLVPSSLQRAQHGTTCKRQAQAGMQDREGRPLQNQRASPTREPLYIARATRVERCCHDSIFLPTFEPTIPPPPHTCNHQLGVQGSAVNSSRCTPYKQARLVRPSCAGEAKGVVLKTRQELRLFSYPFH